MSDSDTVEIPIPAKKEKVRLPRSAAQIAATQRGLEALARRRAEAAAAKPATAPKPKEIKKPDSSYFTPDVMEKAKEMVRTEMSKAKAAPAVAVEELPPAEVKKPAKVSKRKPRMIVVEDSSESEEEVYVRHPKKRERLSAPAPAPAPAYLSGSDLLDSIFFRK
jgi:hypothetical protein